MKKKRTNLVTAPGTPVYTGDKEEKEITIDFYKYNESQYTKKSSNNSYEIIQDTDKNPVNWLNINGIHDIKIIEELGDYYKLHPLLLEDIVNIYHLPKMEEYDNCIFLTLKMLSFDNDLLKIKHEHVSLILGKNFVISFQEREGDIFNPIRERIENDKGKVRKMKADYLFYLLIDAVVDNYYIILDKLEDNIANIEEQISIDYYKSSLNEIIEIRKQIIFLRRSIYPLREAIRKLLSLETKLINININRYINDLHDHLNHIVQDIEIQRDIISGLIDLNNTNLNNKMNNVMKTLTIIATIFIPLTFIAGIYGMNFQFMPELSWKYGYPAVLVIMGIVGIIMLVYMKIKRWF